MDIEDDYGAGAINAAVKGLIGGLQYGQEMKMKTDERDENRRYRDMEFDARVRSDREKKEREQKLDAASKSKEEQDKIYRDRNYNLEVSKFKHTLNKDAQEGGQNGGQGKQLSAADTLKVQEGDNIPNILADVKTTLDKNQGMFGPVAGRLASANPWNTDSQTIDSQFRTASQTFGRYMEGGVLRPDDEAKYRKMFPQLSDTPEVAQNKLAIVNKMLIDRQNANVAALKSQGYRTSGFQTRETPALPGILGGDGLMPSGMMKEASTGDSVLNTLKSAFLNPLSGGNKESAPPPQKVRQGGKVYILNTKTGQYDEQK